jgi:hypothetical protein
VGVKKQIKVLIWIIVLLTIVLFILAIYWFDRLQIAHSTFEDYYKFRGCTELINRTNYYGFCQISSGEIIKIVKYNGKWYLDGDLPSGLFGG